MSRPPTFELLEQEDSWIDYAGDTHAIVDMEDEYLLNLKGWLLRNAQIVILECITHAFRFANSLNGEMAIDAMDAEIAKLTEANPHLWMEKRPFFRAINREIDKRQGVHYCRIIERD